MERAATVADQLVDQPVGDAVRADIIDELVRARAQVHAGEVTQVWMAAQWALAHPAETDADGVVANYAGWGEQRLSLSSQVGPLVPLAGPGAPLVDPRAPLELGAALDRSVDHAQHLLGDALELVFRLPRLGALVQEGRVPVWLARQISRVTHDLSYDAAAHADRLITGVPDKVARVDAARLIHEARLTADPDRAVADEEDALARRGVWLRRDRRAPGVTDVNMTLDADDADLLDATLSRVAADLRDLGDTSSRDVRRATAVGILADPQHALDLMSGRTDRTDPGGPGDTDLVVHLTPADLNGETGTFVEETRGAVSADQLAAWMRRRATHGGRVRVRAVLHDRACRGPRDGRCATSSTTEVVHEWLARHGIDAPVIMLRPIDLSDEAAVDTHDPTPLMHEQVATRDAHCVFPGCRRDSRACGLDHIEPYVPARRRRTTWPDHRRQPRPAVPPAPQRQDPPRLDLPTTVRRQLHLDQPHRPRLPRRSPHQSTAQPLTSQRPDHHPVAGPQARPPPFEARSARTSGTGRGSWSAS